MNEHKKKLEALDKRAEELQANLQKFRVELGITAKELAALDKPKLRHGDYGYDDAGNPCIRIYNYHKAFVVADQDRAYGSDVGIVAVPKINIGNIFDDLKRNQEDLEEFEINQCKVSLDGRGIWLRQGKDYVLIEPQYFTNFVQKLGVMDATIQRKAEK